MNRVILCRCANRKLINISEKVVASLEGQAEVIYVDDLCSSVIENPSAISDICDENTLVLACHSRATLALLDYAKAAKPKKVFDLRSGDGSDFLAYIADSKSRSANVSEIKESSNAWYPCIDYSLCINCAKCMDFCIFGVYAKVDGKVSVVSPTNCKDNCPACARTCPKGAVIFPKCPDLKISGKQEDSVVEEDFYDLLKKRRRRSVLK